MHGALRTLWSGPFISWRIYTGASLIKGAICGLQARKLQIEFLGCFPGNRRQLNMDSLSEDLGKASSGQDFQGTDNGEDQGNSAY